MSTTVLCDYRTMATGQTVTKADLHAHVDDGVAESKSHRLPAIIQTLYNNYA